MDTQTTTHPSRMLSCLVMLAVSLTKTVEEIILATTPITKKVMVPITRPWAKKPWDSPMAQSFSFWAWAETRYPLTCPNLPEENDGPAERWPFAVYLCNSKYINHQFWAVNDSKNKTLYPKGLQSLGAVSWHDQDGGEVHHTIKGWRSRCAWPNWSNMRHILWTCVTWCSLMQQDARSIAPSHKQNKMRSQEAAPANVFSPSEPDEACTGHGKEKNWK